MTGVRLRAGKDAKLTFDLYTMHTVAAEEEFAVLIGLAHGFGQEVQGWRFCHCCGIIW